MSLPKVNIVGCCFTRDLLRCVHDIYGENYVIKFFQCNSPFTIGYDKLSDVTGINITIDDFKIGEKSWAKWFLTNAEETIYEELSNHKSDFLLIDLYELIYPFYSLTLDKKQCRLCSNSMMARNKILEKIPYKFDYIDPVSTEIDFRIDIDNFIKNIKCIYDEDKIIFLEIYPANKLILDNGLTRNIIPNELYIKRTIFLEKYFNYFKNHLNCKILGFPNNLLCDPHHKWGINNMHFVPDVYKHAAPQIYALINCTKTANLMEDECIQDQLYEDMNRFKFNFIKIKTFHGLFIDYYNKRLYQYQENEQPYNLNAIIFGKNRLCIQIKNTGQFISGFDYNGQIITSKKFCFLYIVYTDNKFCICYNLKYLSARNDDIGSMNLASYPRDWEKFEAIAINEQRITKNTLIISSSINHQIIFPHKTNINDKILPSKGIKIINGSNENIIFNIDNSSVFKNCLITVEEDNNKHDNIEISIDKNCILEDIKIIVKNGKLVVGENTIINNMTITLNDNQIYIGKNCYLDGNNILNAMDNNLDCSENLMIYDNVIYFNKFGILYMLL